MVSPPSTETSSINGQGLSRLSILDHTKIHDSIDQPFDRSFVDPCNTSSEPPLRKFPKMEFCGCHTCQATSKARCFGCCQCVKPSECPGCCACGPAPSTTKTGMLSHEAREALWELEDRVWVRPDRGEFGIGSEKLELFFSCRSKNLKMKAICIAAAIELDRHRKRHQCDCDWASIVGRKLEAGNIWRVQLNRDDRVQLYKTRLANDERRVCEQSPTVGMRVKKQVQEHDRICGCSAFGKLEVKPGKPRHPSTERDSTDEESADNNESSKGKNPRQERPRPRVVALPDRHHDNDQPSTAPCPINRSRFAHDDYIPPLESTETPNLDAYNRGLEIRRRALEPPVAKATTAPEPNTAEQERERRFPILAALEKRSREAAAAQTARLAGGQPPGAQEDGKRKATTHDNKNTQDGFGERRGVKHPLLDSYGGNRAAHAGRAAAPASTLPTPLPRRTSHGTRSSATAHPAPTYEFVRERGDDPDFDLPALARNTWDAGRNLLRRVARNLPGRTAASPAKYQDEDEDEDEDYDWV